MKALILELICFVFSRILRDKTMNDKLIYIQMITQITIVNKIIHPVDKNFWLKCLETTCLEPINQK